MGLMAVEQSLLPGAVTEENESSYIMNSIG